MKVEMFCDALICSFLLFFLKKQNKNKKKKTWIQEQPVMMLNLNVVAKLQPSIQKLLFIQNT